MALKDFGAKYGVRDFNENTEWIKNVQTDNANIQVP